MRNKQLELKKIPRLASQDLSDLLRELLSRFHDGVSSSRRANIVDLRLPIGFRSCWFPAVTKEASKIKRAASSRSRTSAVSFRLLCFGLILSSSFLVVFFSSVKLNMLTGCHDLVSCALCRRRTRRHRENEALDLFSPTPFFTYVSLRNDFATFKVNFYSQL